MKQEKKNLIRTIIYVTGLIASLIFGSKVEPIKNTVNAVTDTIVNVL